MRRSSLVMLVVFLLALLALATNITVTVGGLVTLEPGRDPTTAARLDCARPWGQTAQPEEVRREMCCQATCRAYCARDALCQTMCAPGCAR